MKSVVVISAITFGLIFGGLALTSNHIAKMLSVSTARDLATPRSVGVGPGESGPQSDSEQVVRTADELMALRQTRVVQERTLADAQRSLTETVAKLDTAQQRYVASNERSARKLAKMYEAMKPVKAAPILASLDMDIVLEIITRMKERQAARILAQMDAGLAAHISARMSSKGDG